MKQEDIPEKIDLQALIDAPLADPLNINVPLGRRALKRGPRHREYDGIDAPKITREELERRKADSYGDNLNAILDYYASSAVPIERVAEHTGLTIEKATYAMERRGRKI